MEIPDCEKLDVADYINNMNDFLFMLKQRNSKNLLVFVNELFSKMNKKFNTLSSIKNIDEKYFFDNFEHCKKVFNDYSRFIKDNISVDISDSEFKCSFFVHILIKLFKKFGYCFKKYNYNNSKTSYSVRFRK